MKYVSAEAASRALLYVSKFQALPASAGVLFICVVPVSAEGGVTKTYDVVIGMGNPFEPDLGCALVYKVLERELSSGEMLLREVTSVLGYPGAANSGSYSGDARARSPSA